MFVMDTEQEFFSFVVKTHFSETNHRFDQCGVIVYLDSENWLKCSVEYENEIFQHLGSVVTNNGFSDWATTTIPANVKCMWYRLSRRGDDFCFENSFVISFAEMRFYNKTEKLLFCIHNKHWSIVIAKMIISPLPQIRMWICFNF